MRRIRLRPAIALTAAIALLGGCAGGKPGPAGGVATTTPAPTPTTTPGTPAPRPPVTPSTPLSWPSGPRSVVHQPAVPPVPVLEHLRYAAHPLDGYDRIVFDFAHAVPGYTVRYVPEVRADPSDRRVAVPGSHYLLIVFTPAQAHDDEGVATVSGTHSVSLPAIRGWAVAGDFEGHVSVAIGLDRVSGFRTGELPGRVYVDVAAHD